MTLPKLHRLSGIFVALYACVHITNHLAGLSGIETHIEFMRFTRLVYRFPPVEMLLLVAITTQIYSGITFIVRGWKQRHGVINGLQVASGGYMVFFLLNHVGAVLVGRTVLHLDTNFYYAAAGFAVQPFQFFFAPYYFLGVLALFTHLGCALSWKFYIKSPSASMLAIVLPAGIGLLVSLSIVLSLAGVLYPVNVPPEYKTIYGLHS